MFLKIDLNELPWQVAFAVIGYCVENIIELKKCYDFLHQVSYPTGANLDLIFDIPEEHIIWMKLKGVL